MNLLMISGDRSVPEGRKSAFFYTLEELSRHWDRIDIITPAVRNQQSAVVHGNVHFHASPRGLWYQPWWIVRRGRDLQRRYGYNVITSHEYPPFYNGIGACLLGRRIGVPYAMEVHHIVGIPHVASVAEMIGRAISRPYFSSAARRAAAVRVVNADVKSRLAEWGVPEEKIRVVPSFYLDAVALQGVEKPPVAYDLVFCARLVENKGLAPVIHAMARFHDLRLLVVGDGPMRSKYEALSHSLHLGDRVTFAGWLAAREDVVSALKSARAFIMNSTSEGGPRSALEAMGSGLPVISTRVGVMPDVIRDGVNGYFTTGTSDDLVKKIGMLLQDDARREAMGAEAQKILDRFERTKLIGEYADFLKAIAR